MSEEGLQIEKKRSERQRSKGKIYPFNVEFQRIARRDKKAFLSYQGKEIEENNRMGKPKDLFKKIRDAKSLQSCLTLCDPIDGSPPGSPDPGTL